MSRQLDSYLSLRRDGSSVEEASALSGIGMAEAKLTEQALAKGELQFPAAGSAVAQPEKDMADNDENTEHLIELASDTLRGDVRDAQIAWFKAQEKPWSLMSSEEQRDLVAAIDRYSHQLLRQACEIIAAGERPTIVAKLVEYKEKDGVEAKLKLASTGENVGALHEACGREVLLVTAGVEDFTGERAEAEEQVEPDQRELHGIGQEYDEAA